MNGSLSVTYLRQGYGGQARELPTKGLDIRETDWTQVRDMTLPTDERGSLVGLVRYGHQPPEKPLEIELGAVLGH